MSGPVQGPVQHWRRKLWQRLLSSKPWRARVSARGPHAKLAGRGMSPQSSMVRAKRPKSSPSTATTSGSSSSRVTSRPRWSSSRFPIAKCSSFRATSRWTRSRTTRSTSTSCASTWASRSRPTCRSCSSACRPARRAAAGGGVQRRQVEGGGATPMEDRQTAVGHPVATDGKGGGKQDHPDQHQDTPAGFAIDGIKAHGQCGRGDCFEL